MPQKGRPTKAEREGTLVWAKQGLPMKEFVRENDQEREDPGVGTKGASDEGVCKRKGPGKGGGWFGHRRGLP